MTIIQTYYFNIGCELVMIAVLIFLLISCFLQRNRMVTVRPLTLLIFANLLLLLCQASEWMLMIIGGDQAALTEPALRNWKVLTYTLDFFLGSSSSLAFYHYVREHIKTLYEKSNDNVPATKRNPMPLLIIWGIILTAVYGFCMSRSWFYYLRPDGAERFHQEAYLSIYLMANLVTVFTLATLLRHRKVLGRLNFWLLLFYKLSPTALLITDLLHSTCMTYLMRAFYTFILYVHVDLRSEKQAIETEARLARQESELTELRTQIMLSQMQPHFLYNTLTTISSLCFLGKSQQAKDVVDKFAFYFRQNMDALGKEKYIPFTKELEHIKTYLWIEQIRFEDELSVEYKIGPTNFRIPSLTLQPLAENAVKHGICQKDSGGTVTIETKETDKEFLITISDDGVGFDPDVQPDDGRSHVGIENIKQRLEILCGGSLEIQSRKGEGTAATVHLPKESRTL